MNSNKKTAEMNEVSLFRLYLLRALYLLMVVGLGIVQWPEVIDQVIHQEKSWELMDGVVACMLTSLFGSINLGATVSAADVAFAHVGIGVEVDLADRCCAPTVDWMSQPWRRPHPACWS